MLLVVLSKDKAFLDKLLARIEKRQDVPALLHQTQGLGEELIGSRFDIVSGVKWTTVGERFDYALIIALEQEEKLAELKRLITYVMDVEQHAQKSLLICLPYTPIGELGKRAGKL